ncbi:MAG TPA: SDR family oxidoreductase [Gemmatimonadales bacterium]|nr:SDR family oxidoreductase [Gemmatimonadales bacterium]
MSALGGRAAVVTGASRGIGAAIAVALWGAGARVIRIARSIAEGFHDGFHDVPCDLGDPAALERAAARILADHGPPEVVVSNAGLFLLKALEATTPAELDAQIALNLRAPFHLARALLPPMRGAGRGVFVTIGSIVDHAPFADNAAYAATKYAVRGLHETLTAEYRGSGVRLSLVSPGPTDTAVWDPVRPDERAGFIRRADMLRPADVAEAVLFVVTRPPHVHIDWLRINPAS